MPGYRNRMHQAEPKSCYSGVEIQCVRVVLTLALFASCTFAASAPIREVVSECPESAGVPICQIRNGWSLKFDSVSCASGLWT
jgi:hypothetical protein